MQLFLSAGTDEPHKASDLFAFRIYDNGSAIIVRPGFFFLIFFFSFIFNAPHAREPPAITRR